MVRNQKNHSQNSIDTFTSNSSSSAGDYDYSWRHIWSPNTSSLFPLNGWSNNNLGQNRRNNRNNNGIKNPEIEKALIEGCDFVSNCAMTTKGCSDLRRLLGGEDLRMKEMIINKVTADLPILMVHEIGYQFAKAVFDSCDEQAMSRVLQSVVVANNLAFFFISNNYFGKEAAKSLVKNLKVEEQWVVVTNVITDHICSFTNNYNAQQLLQFYIVTCNDFNRKLIFDAIGSNIVFIATNRLGCMTLQCCIYPTFMETDFAPNLLNSIIINSPILADNNYGNYVLQHVIGSGIENVIEYIVGRLEGKFSDLSKSKFGSNVVEKCLEIGQHKEVIKIVMELANSIDLLAIAQQPYGNYVIQTALERAHSTGMEKLYHELVKRINVYSSNLQTHLYGRKVMSKIHMLNASTAYNFRLAKVSVTHR